MKLSMKISDMTSYDLNGVFRPIGTADIPYPASLFSMDSDGEMKMDIGVIADDANPLAVYSDRPHDYVVGQLHRRMAVPSLLGVQKEAILWRAPDSKNRVMIVLGKPGAGKSELAKTIADVCDSRGAEVVDCGGRYMGDLLWEQVIDYGEDFKTALTERIRSGLLAQTSRTIFEEEFPGALIKDTAGAIVDIDWDKTAQRKNKGTEEKPAFESAAEASERCMRIIKTIAERESIPTQAVNSIGIKKIPGIIKRLHDEGRTGILDEYTKSVEGSDDSLQTVLQYMNGEIDEVTLTNSMKVGGREETYSYTLRRSDMKAGFFVYMTGNDQEDGVSTHMLSKSAYSRLPVRKIEDLDPADWRHRISQVLTGLPLSTEYSIFSELAREDPREFADMLVELRMMGLSEDQRAAVPLSQLQMLGGVTKDEAGNVVAYNWERTREAVEKLAAGYMYLARIVDPASDLYDPAQARNKDNIDNILPEISASYRDECAIDFRAVIQDVGEALKVRPQIRKIEPGARLRLNFSAVGRQMAAPVVKPDVMSSEFGTRLEAVLLDRVGRMTEGRFKLRAAIIKEFHERGILTPPQKAGQTSKHKTIAQLLNQDMLADVGGSKAVVALRDALAARLRKVNPGMKNKSYADIVPMDRAIAASEELSRILAEQTDADPRKGRILLLGNDLDRIFKKASAVDEIGRQAVPEPSELVQASEFLDALKIPAVANMNMQGIWRSTLSAEALVPASEETTPIVRIAEGKHETGIGVTTVAMRGVDESVVPVHILRDATRKKNLIVTDSVDDGTKAALSADYTVVAYGSSDAEDRVNRFIQDMLASIPEAEKRATEQQLAFAFMIRAGDEGKTEPLARMMTTRNLPAQAPVYIKLG